VTRRSRGREPSPPATSPPAFASPSTPAAPDAESEARIPTSRERHHTFLFAIDDDVVVDAAVNGNASRWINHSCDPNCDAVIDGGRIWIESIRDIVSGEELAYDYAYILEERHTPAAKKRFPCHCGAENCRGTILAKKR
jgi:hypothetical protein